MLLSSKWRSPNLHHCEEEREQSRIWAANICSLFNFGSGYSLQAAAQALRFYPAARELTIKFNFGKILVVNITLPFDMLVRLQKEATKLNKTVEERVLDVLNNSIAPEENLDEKFIAEGLEKIKTLLEKIPCIQSVASSKVGEPFWWLKFKIDINSKIAWIVVQELGHILNYLSTDEKLPTYFYPVSPPPYLNGGAEEFLYWIIEPTIPFVDTNIIFEFLAGRLPENYDNEESWLDED